MLFLPFRTYNTDNKKSEDSKGLMSIESSLYYFACLVILLQKSIVTLAIIYKFGGYKEKEVKKVSGFTALPLRYQVFPRFVNFGFAMFLYPLVFEIYIH